MVTAAESMARGNAEALCEAGRRLERGDGVQRDDAAARLLYAAVAARGHAAAAAALGFLHLTGRGGLPR